MTTHRIWMTIGLLACLACDSPGAPDLITVTPREATLLVGRTLLVEVGVVDTRGDTTYPLDAVWSSSDPDVATVSLLGLVTAFSEGEATITVRSAELQATVEVEVIPVVEGFWAGTIQTLPISFAFVLAEDEDGSVTGTGTAMVVDSVFTTTVAGEHNFPSVILRFDVEGFVPFVFTGTYEGDRITGTSSGSGLEALTTVFSR